MPKQYADEHLSPADRRREVASILAKGVVHEKRLRPIAAKADWRAQRRLWAQIRSVT